MRGYHIMYKLTGDATERRTFIVAPNPAAAARALHAAIPAQMGILAMRASHNDMPRWIGAPLPASRA